MISPTESLAFAMHTNPGVYAVLAGSGVSRAAQIPTGWDITLDLIRQLAVLKNEPCEPDPEQWYRNTSGKEPDYSNLLHELRRPPAERQQLLRDYIEPNPEERREGVKQPTAAHRAIAALASQGLIRVILTTNFDCLIETALEDESVRPTVVATPDQLQGALPTIHTHCCVYKLHGDYRDTRIRNTQTELDSYAPSFNSLLARIFDEFGLIVCGWSAAWDGALRDALYRASTRRFTTYWATHGDVTDDAQRLIEHRRAVSIPINAADEFFATVQQHVESLREFARPHPVSTEIAVASLKRYLPESRYRIRLADLVDGVVERAIEATSGKQFSVEGPTPEAGEATARVGRYEAACSTLLALAPIGGFWAEEDHDSLWQRALTRLGTKRRIVGRFYETWGDLTRYPAALLLYALGVGAVHGERLRFLGRLLNTSIHEDNQEETRAVQLLAASLFTGWDGSSTMRVSDETAGNFITLNERIYRTLRPHVAAVVPDDNRYRFVFDKFEALLTLGYAHANPELGWAPPGPFTYRNPNKKRIVAEIDASLSSRGDDSPFVSCGIFGNTEKVCRQRLKAVQDLMTKRPW